MTSPVYSATNLQGCSVFRALPAEAFGAGLDAMFPDMGQGAAQSSTPTYERPERFSADVGTAVVQEIMATGLTTLTAWMRRHLEAFSR